MIDCKYQSQICIYVSVIRDNNVELCKMLNGSTPKTQPTTQQVGTTWSATSRTRQHQEWEAHDVMTKNDYFISFFNSFADDAQLSIYDWACTEMLYPLP